MNKYTEDELEQKYNKFIDILKRTFGGERLEKLLHMYSMEELGPNLMISPASGNKYYHNAYEGGYMDHIMNVVNNSLRVSKLYNESGGTINFTREELLFSAFHHDLGKLGQPNELHYIPNTSQWHIDNRGEIYTRNSNLSYMSLTDRTFLTLSKYNIEINENEFFGIKLADGMYDDDNIKYLKTFNIDNALKSHIGHVIHMADYMSTLIERDNLDV